MSRILISAAHKSSGKTTISIGLCAMLRQRGLVVQPFKKGPDYIDPLWLTQAAERPCHNLDFYTQTRDEIRQFFATKTHGADWGLIEGNKGLYDGLDLDGSNSNAALAILLHTPVVLVIDVEGMTRGIAPLLLGYQAFALEVNIAGVIFNKVGGTRHESKLRNVVTHYTDIAIVGAVPKTQELALVERHLGLMPSNEAAEPDKQIANISAIVAEQVDWPLLQRIGAQAEALQITEAAPSKLVVTDADWHLDNASPHHHINTSNPTSSNHKSNATTDRRLRIGIAKDAAFGFYYPGDLEAMQQQGAELITFSPLQDHELPVVDGLFIGGGFPETCMEGLEANYAMRKAIADYIESGHVVYAECGGLMYLARSITWHNQTHRMVGVIAGDAVMQQRPQGRGYVRVRETPTCPWRVGDGQEIAAHEFHYSRLEGLDSHQTFAFEVLRGDGIDGKHDGIMYKNLMAGFVHLRDVGSYHWTQRFLAQVRCVSNTLR